MAGAGRVHGLLHGVLGNVADADDRAGHFLGDLALLLGGHGDLVWFVPTPGDPGLTGGHGQSLMSLLPAGWRFGALQAFVAVILFGLWQARRLGRVVAEPLPVVVRSAETSEGRARMYRGAGAADHAAAILRAAAIERLGVAIGSGRNPDRAVVIEAVGRRTGRDPQQVGALLYGSLPDGTAELVAFAGALDDLERQVRAS